jgi:methionine sulfoxide reductase heme-binding subunit
VAVVTVAMLGSAVTSVWSDPKLTWYLTRSFGLVLLVLFTATTVLGVLTSAPGSGSRVPGFVPTDLHRRLSVLSLVLLAGHIAASVADSFVTITWVDAVVPFVSTYRALWLGLGTLACDLLLLVAVTSALRRRMPPRAWRAVHLTAYALWPLVVLHTLGTGTDARSVPLLALTAGCTAAVVAAVGWRLARRPGPSRRLRLAALVVMPLAVLVTALWAWSGPLAPGWAKRAGTPAPSTGPVPAAAASATAGVSR